MVEFIFKIGILITIGFAILAAVSTIPAFAALVTTTTGTQATLMNSIGGITSFMQSYVTPFIGALNLIIPSAVRNALTALIVWKLIKPLAFKILAPLEGALEKLIEKA